MVWRGGITDVTASTFPAPVRYALVLRLEADPDEATRLHEMSTGLYYAGVPLAPPQSIPLALKIGAGEPRLYLNVVVNLAFVVFQPGEGYVEVVFDRELVVPRVYFRVGQQPGAQQILPSPPP